MKEKGDLLLDIAEPRAQKNIYIFLIEKHLKNF